MIRWVVWTIYVVAWTVALEVPVPTSEEMPSAEFILTRRMLFSKCLHVAAYSVFAILCAWVPLNARHRPILMFLLMAHATGTEMLQDYLRPYCHRGGDLYDAALDHVGIALGVLVSWKWWTREDPPRPGV